MFQNVRSGKHEAQLKLGLLRCTHWSVYDLYSIVLYVAFEVKGSVCQLVHLGNSYSVVVRHGPVLKITLLTNCLHTFLLSTFIYYVLVVILF